MKYLELIEQYRDEFTKSLQELISFPSVEGKPEPGAPFGAGVRDAYQYMLEKGKAEGFATFDADGYGGHIDFGGWLLDEEGLRIAPCPETMGILVHLDVVPEGNDWTYPPFGGELVDGVLYGRGMMDNKGPAMAAFYAMKALKDSGFVPAKKVRLILGLDEETSWKGMEYYLQRTEEPDFSVTPDADFPLIHGEKGMMVFEIARKLHKSAGKGLILRNLSGGNAANMVADWAKALVRGDSYDDIKAKVAEYRKETGRKLTVKGRGKSLEILAEGVSAHGATPQKGLNAISILMDFLGRVDFPNPDLGEFIDFYNNKIGFELDGKSLGCSCSDALSGELILNVGQIHVDEEAAILTVNIRHPLSTTDQKVYDAMLPALNAYDLGLVKVSYKPPLFVPKDDPLVETLMKVYQRHTGDLDSKPQVIGGGTYARAVKNAVAFGMCFPDEVKVEHQRDECKSLDSLILATKIYADAIYELTMPETKMP